MTIHPTAALTSFRTLPSHVAMANAVRFLAADAVENAKSGHPGMPMGMADVATVLFSRFLKFDAADPRWPDRDRLVRITAIAKPPAPLRSSMASPRS
jgi:transketolase